MSLAAAVDPEPRGGPDAMRRRLWAIVQATLFRYSFHNWYGVRRRLLGAFGATIDPTAWVRPTVRIDRPWNLTLGRKASLGDGVRVWAEAPVTVGDRTVVSQYTTVSTWRVEPVAGRDARRTVAPVTLGDDVWVATESHVDAGTTVRDGALVGARSVVRGEVPPWVIAAGDPLKVRGERPYDGERHGLEGGDA